MTIIAGGLVGYLLATAYRGFVDCGEVGLVLGQVFHLCIGAAAVTLFFYAIGVYQ